MLDEKVISRMVDDMLMYLALGEAEYSTNLSPRDFGSPIPSFGYVLDHVYQLVGGAKKLLEYSDGMKGLWSGSMMCPSSKGDGSYVCLGARRIGIMERSRLINLRCLSDAYRTKDVVRTIIGHIATDGKIEITQSFVDAKSHRRVDRMPVSVIETMGCSYGPDGHSVVLLGSYTMDPKIEGMAYCFDFGKIAAWMEKEFWSVILSNGVSSLTLPCGAGAAKEFFKKRDRPDGATRRESLMNWVRSHWRVNYRNEEEEIEVRKHLRGGVRFKWFDMDCLLRPSSHDSMLNDRLREEKKQAGSIRRPVVSI